MLSQPWATIDGKLWFKVLEKLCENWLDKPEEWFDEQAKSHYPDPITGKYTLIEGGDFDITVSMEDVVRAREKIRPTPGKTVKPKATLNEDGEPEPIVGSYDKMKINGICQKFHNYFFFKSSHYSTERTYTVKVRNFVEARNDYLKYLKEGFSWQKKEKELNELASKNSLVYELLVQKNQLEQMVRNHELTISDLKMKLTEIKNASKSFVKLVLEED